MDRSQLAGVPSAQSSGNFSSVSACVANWHGTCLTYTTRSYAKFKLCKAKLQKCRPNTYTHIFIYIYKARHIFILNQSAAQQSLSPAPTPNIKEPASSTWQQVKNLNHVVVGGAGWIWGNSTAPAQYANFCECFTYLFYLLFVCLFFPVSITFVSQFAVLSSRWKEVPKSI